MAAPTKGFWISCWISNSETVQRDLSFSPASRAHVAFYMVFLVRIDIPEIFFAALARQDVIGQPPSRLTSSDPGYCSGASISSDEKQIFELIRLTANLPNRS